MNVKRAVSSTLGGLRLSPGAKRLPAKVFCWLAICFAAVVHAGSSSYVSVEEALLHAKTYYWLGISDKRDAGAFRQGLAHVTRALDLLAREKAGDTIPEATYVNLKRQAEQLHLDLAEQEKLSAFAFGGHFPLARFLGLPVFVNADSFGSFEIVEDPLAVGSQQAALYLGDVLQHSLLGDSQVALLVVSPRNAFPDMESMVRMMLKQFPRIKVHELSALAKVLTDNDIASLIDHRPSPSSLDSIFSLLGCHAFAIASVSRINQIEDLHFLRIVTRLYRPGDSAPFDSIVTYQLQRDKRKAVGLWLGFAVVLIAGSVCWFACYCKKNTGQLPFMGSLIGAPLASFAAGFLVSCTVAALFASFRPSLHNHIAYSGWWVFLTLGSMVWAPPIIFRNLVSRSTIFAKLMGVSGRQRIFFGMVALGAVAHPSLGLFLYHPLPKSLVLSGAGAIIFASSAYLGGAWLDHLDRRSGAALLFCNAILLPLGFYWLSAGNNLVALSLTGGAILLLIPARSWWFPSHEGSFVGTAQMPQGTPRNVAELIDATQNPPYYETPCFADICSRIHQRNGVQSHVFCLTGSAGAGKTATANRLVQKIKAVESSSGKPVLVLYGRCQENPEQQSSYAPIREILRDYFHINPLADQQAQIMQIDDFLDGMFGRFVPFSGLLFPGGTGCCATASSEEELKRSVWHVLKKLSQRQFVIVFIDDLHWADEATASLLRFLHQSLDQDPSGNMLFLYTARPDCEFLEMISESEAIPLSALNQAEQLSMLRQSLGIDRDSSAAIVGWAGHDNRCSDNLFWLLKVVEHLARLDGFVAEEGRFRLRDSLLGTRRPPIPREYSDSIRKELADFSDFETLIAAAAAIGVEFPVSVLAQSVGLEELECLKQLQELERRSNMIYDVLEKDGVFSFRSSFALEAVRQILGIEDEDVREGGVRQIVRELHCRIGGAMRKLGGSDDIMMIAKHLYGAGPRHADAAADACIEAASSCARIFRYDEARGLLEKARRRVQGGCQKESYDLRRLLCECEIAHLEGKNREANAKDCQMALERCANLNNECLLVFARSFYDARMFDQCQSLSLRVFESSTTPIEAAAALHFMAISLPPADIESRREKLLAALDKFDPAENINLQAMKLRARILNSLGETNLTLAASVPKYREQAKRAFLESIALKERPEISDTPGLAISYGGLGRLALFIEPTDAAAAREYFETDLQLAEQVGDIAGQAMMHSLLGQCALRQGDYEGAKSRYLRSLELAQNTAGRFYAYLGLLRILSANPDEPTLNETVESLCHLLHSETIPSPLLQELTALLLEVAGSSTRLWVERIENAIRRDSSKAAVGANS